jgi:hypothetical protein
MKIIRLKCLGWFFELVAMLAILIFGGSPEVRD